MSEILELLHKQYKNPKTELENWKNPIQFMACVILSAQATDVGVNKISKNLFSKYKTAQDFAKADLSELETYVRSINYYKTKAKRIIDACKFIIENYKGEMPDNIEDLIKIPGIGRKSANVIIYEALNKEDTAGIVVDTHVTRVSQRLGLIDAKLNNAVKIEIELQKIIPKNEWKFYSSAIVLHGRYVCKAKKPNCEECVLNKICPSAFSFTVADKK